MIWVTRPSPLSVDESACVTVGASPDVKEVEPSPNVEGEEPLPSGESTAVAPAAGEAAPSPVLALEIRVTGLPPLSLELRQLLTQPSWQTELEISAIDNKLLQLELQLPPLQTRLRLNASGDTSTAVS